MALLRAAKYALQAAAVLLMLALLCLLTDPEDRWPYAPEEDDDDDA